VTYSSVEKLSKALLKGVLPLNYSDRQAANWFWISLETFHASEDDVIIMAALFSVLSGE
jgi:hypothetical protein